MYNINVRTIEGHVLRFKVLNYELREGLVIFTDTRTGLVKSFPTSACNIDEVKE